jgi:hypothetical protein
MSYRFDADTEDAATVQANLEVLDAAGHRFRRIERRQEDDGLVSVWYHGPSHCDLLSWERDDKIVRQELCFCGELLQWTGGSLETGRVLQDLNADRPMGASLAVAMQAQLSQVTLQYAAHFLQHLGHDDDATTHLRQIVDRALEPNPSPGARTVIMARERYETSPHPDLPELAEDAARVRPSLVRLPVAAPRRWLRPLLWAVAVLLVVAAMSGVAIWALLFLD